MLACSVGYHSSYKRAGRYYALEGIPRFDEDGLAVIRATRVVVIHGVRDILRP